MSRAGFSSSTTAICWTWLMSDLAHVRFGSCHRQLHDESRTLCVPRAFNRDPPAVQIDDTLDDRKPESGRGLAGGRLGRKSLKTAEQSRNVLRRKARALIPDL